MPRGLSTAVKAALAADKVEYYHLVKFGFPGGSLYYTTCPYDIDYGGNTYVSSAILTKIPDVKESLKISPSTFSLTTAGANLAMQALSLADNKLNAEVLIYLYIPSETTGILINKGFIDGYTADEDPQKGESTINWRVANHWSNWDQSSSYVLTNEKQQELYPGDLGLEYISKIGLVPNWWGTMPLFQNTSNAAFGSIFVLEDYGFVIGSAFNYGNFVLPGFQRSGEESFKDLSAETKTLPVIYGQHTIQGMPVFKTLSGPNSEFLHVVYALSAGECDSLVDMTIDDTSYTDPFYSSNVTVTFHGGSSTQAADSSLVAATPFWTTNHRLRGICYVHVVYEYDEDIFQGEPQPVFTIKGKKCYNPVTTTTVYTENPAMHTLDYLTGTLYGKGLDSSEVGGITSALSYADQNKTNHDESSGGTATTIKRQAYSDVIRGGEIKKNCEHILSSMLGHLPWISGVYTLVTERDNETSAFSFDIDNIKSGITVSEDGAKSKYNAVYASFKDEDNNYITSGAQSVSSAFLALDNGKESSLKVTLRGETNRYRAKNRAATLLKRSREQTQIEFTASHMDALEVTAGDIIDITYEPKGWTAKLFRVFDLIIKADGDIDIKAMEYSQTTYDWAVSVEDPLPADTDLPDPMTVTAPTALTLASGTDQLLVEGDGTIISRIKVSFTAPADAYVIGYELQYKKATDTAYINAPTMVGLDNDETFISPVQDGVSYNVRVRAMNGIARKSAWVSGTHTVIGKTEPPSNVSTFKAYQNGINVVFKWSGITDADLKGYEIRYGDRGASSWLDSVELTKATKGTNVTTADVPPGDHTFYIKAIDTTGNYSTTATSSNLVVTAEQDIIYQFTSAPDWTGATLTNLVKHHTGKLVPQSQSLASASGWDTFDTFVDNPYTSCSVETPEADIDFDDSVRVWFDTSLALGPGEAGDISSTTEIDHRLTGGTYDGFETWSVGQLTLRYMKSKLTLNVNGSVPYINYFNPTIDVLEHVVSESAVVIAAGGSTVTFPTQFHTAPFVRVFINGTTALYPTRSNITATGFDCDIFNAAGSNVGGSIDYEAIGS